MSIDIKVFLVEMRSDVDRFEADWLAKNKAEPENYPLRLEPGDWMEQFMVFIGLEQ
jgi:hypothetical protein